MYRILMVERGVENGMCSRPEKCRDRMIGMAMAGWTEGLMVCD